MTSAINWIDDKTFELGDVRFHLDLGRTRPASSERLILMKDRPLVDCYERMFAGLQVKRVVELGIWGGGGTIFLERLLKPEKLVAIDRAEERVSLLRDPLDERRHGTRRALDPRAAFQAPPPLREAAKLLSGSFARRQNAVIDSPLCSKRASSSRHSASVRRTRPSAKTCIGHPPRYEGDFYTNGKGTRKNASE
jgi:hypothetical protein